MSTRVLVVDDESIFRRAISEALSGLPGVEVVGTASNGRLALARLSSLQPDLMTLDVEMPEMNGLETLKTMRDSGVNTSVIMLSSLTVRGGDMTIRALEAGAFDFITKPEGGSQQDNLTRLRGSLGSMIQALERQREIRSILKAKAPKLSLPGVPNLSPNPSPTHRPQPPVMPAVQARSRSGPPIVLIGVSTGGPVALAELLPMLGSHVGAPIFIVQHMPPHFTEALAQRLQTKSTILGTEAHDCEMGRAGCAYRVPRGVERLGGPGAGGEVVAPLTDGAPENAGRARR